MHAYSNPPRLANHGGTPNKRSENRQVQAVTTMVSSQKRLKTTAGSAMKTARTFITNQSKLVMAGKAAALSPYGADNCGTKYVQPFWTIDFVRTANHSESPI